jgi:hypothetical protein
MDNAAARPWGRRLLAVETRTSSSLCPVSCHLSLPVYNLPTTLLTPQGERFVGSMSAIKARAPVLGGNFGIWGGLFSSYDCAVKGYRQKEDPWNAIISGFLVGGTLAFRCE